MRGRIKPADWFALRSGVVPVAEVERVIRRRTQAANRAMREFRAVPLERRAWYVELTATAASHEALHSKLVRGTHFEPQKFWVRARRVAKWYVERDHAAGGSGSMFAVENRHCRVCGRVLIAQEAREYRERMRWPKHTWHYQQGPACSVECKPAEIIRNSKNRRKAS